MKVTYDTGREPAWALGDSKFGHVMLGPCPQCGTHCISPAEKTWSCSNINCRNSAMHRPPQDWSTAPFWWGGVVRVRLDGNAWQAYDSTKFVNLQESPSGFGPTPHDAVAALIRDMKKHQEANHKPQRVVITLEDKADGQLSINTHFDPQIKEGEPISSRAVELAAKWFDFLENHSGLQKIAQAKPPGEESQS